MNKILKIVQAGDKKQCKDNRIINWEYCFGLHNNSDFGLGRHDYMCSRGNGKAVWSISNPYKTSFNLELKFEEKVKPLDFEPNDIPF